MTTNELLNRIHADPTVCGGKPCIRGTRIWVTLVLDLLADGMTLDEVLREYPQLTVLDVRACIAYASEMSRERVIDLGKGPVCV